MPEVLDIEANSFEFPWLEEDFIRCLRQRNCLGIVAEHENLVKGFMIYELTPTSLSLLNFATHPDYLRQGIGSQMVDKLIGKLSAERKVIKLEQLSPRDFTKLTPLAELFFESQGFGISKNPKIIQYPQGSIPLNKNFLYLMSYGKRLKE